MSISCVALGVVRSMATMFSTYIDSPKEGLTGQFPQCLAHCSGVTHLKLSGNKIQGPLPLDLCSTYIPYITYLDLSNNRFSGQIPDVSNYSWLRTLLLQNNYFSGTIPPQLGLLPRQWLGLKCIMWAIIFCLDQSRSLFMTLIWLEREVTQTIPDYAGSLWSLVRWSSQTKSNSHVRVLKSNSVIMVAAVGFVFSSFFLLNPKEFPLCGLHIWSVLTRT